MELSIPHSRLDELRPENAHGFSPSEVHGIMDEIYARGDRLMVWFLASHMLLALVLAFFHGTWLATVLVGGGACLSFAVFARLFPRTFFTRAYAGIAQQAFVALHIYQLHGQSEQHFWYFTAFTMMIVYQDWLCMWPGALLIILQHTIFAALHNSGVPVHFFPEEHVGVSKLFFHFGIALVHVSLCGYWALLLKAQTLGDSWQKLQLQRDRGLLEEQLRRLQESESALTERSAELAKSSRQQRAILDNSADSMWVKGLDGQYIAVNSAFARFARRSKQEIEGGRASDFFAAEVANDISQQDKQVIETRSSLTVEREIMFDGELRTLEATITPIFDAHGVLTGTTGVARDITFRKKEEEERQRSDARVQHAQKLESLGLLAGGIAHDFNNLLVGILANAELARDELPPGSAALESCSQIVDSAQRAAELTRQMLAYAGKGRFEVRQLNMSEEVESTLDLLRSVISKKAELKLELATDLPMVAADATQLRQVVMNLITNASDALGDDEGVITLRTTSRRVLAGEVQLPLSQDELPEGQYVLVEVSDTGEGMDQDTISRIFDPFFTTKFVGRGLGLAAVLGILRGHRGGVEISSERQRGSSFRVYLPALSRSAMVEPSVPRSDPPSNGAPKSGLVVVVDDEPTVRALATSVLTRNGYRVVSADDGIKALQLLDTHKDDVRLVLLDMLMPRMNGEETLREIRQRFPSVPVLLNSGYSEEVAAQQLLTDELVGFVQKPYGVNQLLGAVHELIGRAPPRVGV